MKYEFKKIYFGTHGALHYPNGCIAEIFDGDTLITMAEQDWDLCGFQPMDNTPAVAENRTMGFYLFKRLLNN